MIKSTFSELPAGTMPDVLLKKNNNNMPYNALILTTVVGTIFITAQFLLSETVGAELYYLMYDMSTMALILPYVVLTVSYVLFRRKKLVSGYQMVKSDKVAMAIGI